MSPYKRPKRDRLCHWVFKQHPRLVRGNHCYTQITTKTERDRDRQKEKKKIETEKTRITRLKVRSKEKDTGVSFTYHLRHPQKRIQEYSTLRPWEVFLLRHSEHGMTLRPLTSCSKESAGLSLCLFLFLLLCHFFMEIYEGGTPTTEFLAFWIYLLTVKSLRMITGK